MVEVPTAVLLKIHVCREVTLCRWVFVFLLRISSGSSSLTGFTQFGLLGLMIKALPLFEESSLFNTAVEHHTRLQSLTFMLFTSAFFVINL
jgi:hypothetical protein